MIALFWGVIALVLWVGRHDLAEIFFKGWVTYKRWTGYEPRRQDGPRIRSTVISKKSWEEVA